MKKEKIRRREINQSIEKLACGCIHTHASNIPFPVAHRSFSRSLFFVSLLTTNLILGILLWGN